MTLAKKLKSFNVLISIFLIHTFLISADMPPMPPMMAGDINKPLDNKPLHTKKLSSIADCGTLPPMIIFLPPPMEKSLISCRNQYFKPSKKDASKKLSEYYKKKIRVTKVSVVKHFRELYKISISGKKGDYVRYCNKGLYSCLK